MNLLKAELIAQCDALQAAYRAQAVNSATRKHEEYQALVEDWRASGAPTTLKDGLLALAKRLQQGEVVTFSEVNAVAQDGLSTFRSDAPPTPEQVEREWQPDHGIADLKAFLQDTVTSDQVSTSAIERAGFANELRKVIRVRP